MSNERWHRFASNRLLRKHQLNICRKFYVLRNCRSAMKSWFHANVEMKGMLMLNGIFYQHLHEQR